MALSQHAFLHMATSPLRMLCLGIAPHLCTNDIAVDPKSGYAWFTKIGFAIMEFLEKPSLFMALPVVAFLLLLGPFWALETVLGGPVLAPTVLCILVAMYRLHAASKRAMMEQKKIQ